MFFSHPFHNLGKHVWLPTLCYMRASRSCAWLIVELCIPTKDISRTCLKPTRIVTEQTVLLNTIKMTIGGWSHTTKWQRIRCQASTFVGHKGKAESIATSIPRCWTPTMLQKSKTKWRTPVSGEPRALRLVQNWSLLIRLLRRHRNHGVGLPKQSYIGIHNMVDQWNISMQRGAPKMVTGGHHPNTWGETMDAIFALIFSSFLRKLINIPHHIITSHITNIQGHKTSYHKTQTTLPFGILKVLV